MMMLTSTTLLQRCASMSSAVRWGTVTTATRMHRMQTLTTFAGAKADQPAQRGVSGVVDPLARKASQRLATEMRQKVTNGRFSEAREIFDLARSSGAADGLHWSMMLELCETSTERQIMMGEMAEAGFKPTAMTYSNLLRQLMLEGKCYEARAVVEKGMPAAGVVPNGRVMAVFEKSEPELSRIRMGHLKRLVRTGTTEAKGQAQTLFDELKASGAADVSHWSLMQRLHDSTGQRSMLEEMEAAGVKPDVATYSMLAGQLMVEGKYDEARAVVEREMPAAGVVPNDRTHAVFERSEEALSRIRRQHLQSLLKDGTPKAQEQAQTFFDELKASGAASVFHWSLMQRFHDSTGQRSMMEEMEAAGVKPNVATYSMLANQLMVEGKYDEARAVVEREMPAAGVVPNDRTHAVFEKSEETLSKSRTRHLLNLLKEGTSKATEQAQTFFDELKASEAADAFHWNVMQQHRTSTRQRSMMEEMEAAGVKPNVATYNTMINQLMLEGKHEEARAVVEREMPAVGLVPNDRTHAVLQKSDEEWNKMRMKPLQNLREANTVEAKRQAQTFFDGLKASGATDVFHWNVMQQLSYASTQRRGLMEEMEAAGVKPNLMTYDMLASQLMLEGKHEEARAVVEREMPAAGVVPDDRIYAVLERSDETLSKMRTRRLQELLKEGTPKATEQAQTFFDGLKASGTASVFQWNVMQQQRTSTGRRNMLKEMEAAGVKPDAATYNTMINQLMLEGKHEEARAVVEREMPAGGVVPDDRTHAPFEKSDEEWSKMRARYLLNLHKEGTPKATEQAQTFFDGLKGSGVVDKFHWNVMQQMSYASTHRRGLMEEMEAAGVKPNLMTYDMLASQLMLEGKHEEARAVVEREMPAAGVVPDDRIYAVLKKSDEELSKMRTRRLQELLKEGTPKAKEQAQTFFDGLKASGVVNRFHWHVMDGKAKKH